MILKQVDECTWSIEGEGVIAVISSSNAFRWVRLFANAQDTLMALKDLLREAEIVVTLDGFNPEDFHVIRAAQEAIAQGGG